jgi:hypothetical protein
MSTVVWVKRFGVNEEAEKVTVRGEMPDICDLKSAVLDSPLFNIARESIKQVLLKAEVCS